MLPRKRNDLLIPAMAVVTDAAAIGCSFLLSYWIRFSTPAFHLFRLTEEQPPLGAYLAGAAVIMPVWLLIMNSRGMYGARRNVSAADDLLTIIRVVTLGMLVVMSGAFFYRAFSYSRVVFGLLWIVSIVLISMGRWIVGSTERMLYRRGRELRHAVIAGTSLMANRICASLERHPLLGYNVVGYVGPSAAQAGEPLAAVPYLGDIAGAAEELRRRNIELVLMGFEPGSHESMIRLLESCEGVDVEFLMVPDFLEVMSSGVTVTEIAGVPFIRLKGVPMTTWDRLLKRSFDSVVAIALFLITLPVFVIIAMLIKLGSRGPVLFRQDRVGLDGRRFTMLKFRSMREGAEADDNDAGLGLADDPRRTAVGKFLRVTSLDELPQLINVIRGDMSLVGPRPERPYFVEQFSRGNGGDVIRVPKYLDRHRVLTGMTGWAQVNGLRGNTSISERIKYDLFYIENWSFTFDLKILLRTIGALLHWGG